jgi:hypothetical protein
MNSITDKLADRARLSAVSDRILREISTPSPRTESLLAELEHLRCQLAALEREIQSVPLGEREVIELTRGDYSGRQFLVKGLCSSKSEEEFLLQHLCATETVRLTRAQLECAGLRRKAKWSGNGPVPAVGSEVFVLMNGLGPATVFAHEIVEGWLGLRVRFHEPPAWWRRQNADPRRCGLVFGAEIRG